MAVDKERTSEIEREGEEGRGRDTDTDRCILGRKCGIKANKREKRITAFYSDHRACTTLPPMTVIPFSLTVTATAFTLKACFIGNPPHASYLNGLAKESRINYNTRRTTPCIQCFRLHRE